MTDSKTRLTKALMRADCKEAIDKLCDVKCAFDDRLKMLSEFADDTLRIANVQGRYDNNPTVAPLLMHIVSEVAEASESTLLNEVVTQQQLSKLLVNFDVDEFERTVKNKAGDEFADIILLALSIARYLGYDIAKHLILKSMYNEQRKKRNINHYE